MIKKQNITERLKQLKLSHVLTMVIFAIVFFGAVYGIIMFQTSKNSGVEPKVEILYPLEGDAFDFETTVVEGRVENAKEVTINDVTVEADSDGVFMKEVNLLEGENTISVVATRGDKEFTKEVNVSRVEPIAYEEVYENVNPVTSAPEVTNLSSSGPETLWIPEITALSLAGASWYGSKKRYKKSLNK